MKPLAAILTVVVIHLLASTDARAEHHTPAGDGRALARELAERYGLSAWADVQRIDFTFEVRIGDRHVIRPWSWDVSSRTVVANAGTPEAVTFSLDEVTEDLRPHHRNFINDSYWLLFPFYVVWSENTLTDRGEAAMPISGSPARMLTVQYAGDGGYTPGDAYDLYLDPQSGLIAEWAFRRGGGEQALPATWEQNHAFSGLTIARMHRGPDASAFELSFPTIVVWTTQGQKAGLTPAQ